MQAITPSDSQLQCTHCTQLHVKNTDNYGGHMWTGNQTKSSKNSNTITLIEKLTTIASLSVWLRAYSSLHKKTGNEEQNTQLSTAALMLPKQL